MCGIQRDGGGRKSAIGAWDSCPKHFVPGFLAAECQDLRVNPWRRLGGCRNGVFTVHQRLGKENTASTIIILHM